MKKESNTSSKQKSALYNIEMLYNKRNNVIKLFNDYSTIASEAKYKVTHGDGLKVLTPKQVF